MCYQTDISARIADQNFHPVMYLYFVEVDFLWNRTVDSLKTSFHPLLWTSSGLGDS